MSIRREPTYLSREVWRALWLLSRSETSETKAVTPDELADILLRNAIAKQYPQLFEHQREIDKLEKKLIESLKK